MNGWMAAGELEPSPADFGREGESTWLAGNHGALADQQPFSLAFTPKDN